MYYKTILKLIFHISLLLGGSLIPVVLWQQRKRKPTIFASVIQKQDAAFPRR